MADISSPSGSRSRKSKREKRKRMSFSPEPKNNSKVPNPCVKKAKKKKGMGSAFSPDRPFDRLPNGMPFSCDLCKSPYVCNPLMSKRASRVKRSRHMPSPRFKYDMVTGKTQTLCNACGLAFDRPKRPKKVAPVMSSEQRSEYLQEVRGVATKLAQVLGIPEVEMLYCPNVRVVPCECIQNYIDAGDKEAMENRAKELLALHQESKKLSALKFYDVEKLSKGKRYRNIGLGNGQKRSAVYEVFVLDKREILRKQFALCERATQKILRYSNNFLHKRLKTDERGSRAPRVKGKAAMGLLQSLGNLHKEKCCIDNCVRMSITHIKLLEQWRDRAASGQQEARRVLGEMLTPSGGVRSNCYRFITWVTGCSASTIGKVNEQMKQTGGEREPPQHGLRRYWLNNPRRVTGDIGQSPRSDLNDHALCAVPTDIAPASSTVSSPARPVESSHAAAPVTSVGTAAASAPQQSPTAQQNVERQSQLIQHQTQLLIKLLEQQTQIVQHSLLQQIAQPEATQNIASVEGMLSQLGQMQAAAYANTSIPANAGLCCKHGNSTPPHLLKPHQSHSTPTAVLAPRTKSPANPTAAMSQSKSIATVAPIASSSKTSGIASQIQHGFTEVRTSAQHPTQPSNPGVSAIPVSVISSPQSSMLHVQQPSVQNVQLGFQQHQYILQEDANKAAASQIVSVRAEQEVVDQGKNDQSATMSIPITILPVNGGSSVEISVPLVQISNGNSHRREDSGDRPGNAEPIQLVKIGDQIHQVLRIGQPGTVQGFPQPAQVQTDPAAIGMRIPVIQMPLTTESQLSVSDTRPQLQQCVKVSTTSANPEHQHQQSLCVPRLPVASPISLQQFQHLLILRQQQEAPGSLHQSTVLVENNSQNCTNSPKRSVPTDFSPASHTPVCSELRAPPNPRKVADSRIPSTTGLLQSAPPHMFVQPSSEHAAPSTTASSLKDDHPYSQTVKQVPSLFLPAEIANDSTPRLNFVDVEVHALADYSPVSGSPPEPAQSGNTLQSSSSSSGINCALVVQPVQSASSDSTTSSGIQSSGHLTPSHDVDEMLRSFFTNRNGDLDLFSPLTLPDSLTRSRNNSGESVIEPTISIDVSSFPKEILNMVSQQTLAFTISNGQAGQNSQ